MPAKVLDNGQTDIGVANEHISYLLKFKFRSRTRGIMELYACATTIKKLKNFEEQLQVQELYKESMWKAYFGFLWLLQDFDTHNFVPVNKIQKGDVATLYALLMEILYNTY